MKIVKSSPKGKKIHMFSTFLKTNIIFSVTSLLASANAFHLDLSKIVSYGKVLSQMTNFRLFQKKKEFADDNLKFDKTCGKFSKLVDYTVEKAEIAHAEKLQSFLFSVFLKELY